MLDSVEQAFRVASNAGVFVANSAGNSGPGASTLDHPSPWLTTVGAATFRRAFQARSARQRQPLRRRLDHARHRQSDPARDGRQRQAGRRRDIGCRALLRRHARPGEGGRQDRGLRSRRQRPHRQELRGQARRRRGHGPRQRQHQLAQRRLPLRAAGPRHATPTAPPSRPTSPLSRCRTPRPRSSRSPRPSSPPRRRSLRSPTSPRAARPRRPAATSSSRTSQLPVTTSSRDRRRRSPIGRTLRLHVGHVDGLATHRRHRRAAEGAPPDLAPVRDQVGDHDQRHRHRVERGMIRSPRAPASSIRTALPTRASSTRQPTMTTAHTWSGLAFSSLPPFDTLPPIAGYDLNQASIAVGGLPGSITVHRHVKNVTGSTRTFSASASVPGFVTSVTPATLTLAAGEDKPFTVTFTRTDADFNDWAIGSLTWTDGTYNVRSPITLRPVAVAAPSEVHGDGGQRLEGIQRNAGLHRRPLQYGVGPRWRHAPGGQRRDRPVRYRQPQCRCRHQAVPGRCAGRHACGQVLAETADNPTDDLDLFVYEHGTTTLSTCRRAAVATSRSRSSIRLPARTTSTSTVSPA